MRVFRVPMNRWVIFGFFLAVTGITATTAWAFRSGLTWTAICLIAVAGPLSLLYWYMLLVNPARAEIGLTNDGLTLSGPPFLDLALPWSDVTHIERIDMGTDPKLAAKTTKRGMKFGLYRCGVFILADGREAFVLGNNNDAVFLDAGEVLLLLAPDLAIELFEALQEHTK